MAHHLQDYLPDMRTKKKKETTPSSKGGGNKKRTRETVSISASPKKRGRKSAASKDKENRDKKEKQENGKSEKADFEFAWRTETGIDFVHNSGFDDKRVFPAANGSGIGVIDFDRDGFQDLYFGSGKHFPADTTESKTPSQLFRNLGGWKFENCSDQASAIENGYASGIAIGDFDNDGFQDLYVGCYGENVLYRNLGDGSTSFLRRRIGSQIHCEWKPIRRWPMIVEWQTKN